MPYNLLIVDDEEDVLVVLDDLFSSRGYLVSTAKSGQEALKLMEDVTPDLILADYKMPDMDGIELLTASQERYPDAVRIVLTAHGDLNVAIAAINEADVYKFITKPWNNNDLILTVQRALEHYGAVKQNQAFSETMELVVEENTQEIERLRTALHEIADKIKALLP